MGTLLSCGKTSFNNSMTSMISKNPDDITRVFLRTNQSDVLYKDPVPANSSSVNIYTYNWVHKLLQELSNNLFSLTQSNIQVAIFGCKTRRQPEDRLLNTLVISGQLSLKWLQILARNESENITGVIPFQFYRSPPFSKKLVLTLKDLVRQTVIVGKDCTEAYGGYPGHNKRHEQEEEVYICDLVGLQFQKYYNSGRLVLIKKDGKLSEGILDNAIFQNIVGERRKTFQEAAAEAVPNEINRRYQLINSSIFSSQVFFDRFAYQKFVAQDFVLCCSAIDAQFHADKECQQKEIQHKNHVNFKFLKYGSGYFAGEFQAEIETNILPGVLLGIETYFESQKNKATNVSSIKRVELPFYTSTDTACTEKLANLEKKYNIEICFSNSDALFCDPKLTSAGFINAVTNCSDPHSPTGNEMGFSSVDAMIATNLKSNGNIFCPLINKTIGEIVLEDVSWNNSRPKDAFDSKI